MEKYQESEASTSSRESLKIMVSVFFSIYLGIKGSNHLLKGLDCLLDNRAFLYQLLAINRF